MKCDEVQSLADPYLDSELDAKTSLEIQQHLTACPDCARSLAAAQTLDAQISQALRQGPMTEALWKNTERLVAAAARERAGAADPLPEPAAAPSGWRVWLWPSPQFYAGVLAVWVVLLGLNAVNSDPSPGAARKPAPASPETVKALVEQRHELAELLGLPTAPKPRSKSERSQPHGDARPHQPGFAPAAGLQHLIRPSQA
jgi:anti-sigma factor RsiW